MEPDNRRARVRWVIHPSDWGALAVLDVPSEPGPPPAEDEIVTRPFVVDRRSGQPVPVRVLQRVDWGGDGTPTCVVVVTRADS